jgi:hypothetical protein
MAARLQPLESTVAVNVKDAREPLEITPYDRSRAQGDT